MIGGAVPEDRQGRFSYRPAERFQQFQGGLTVSALVRGKLDVALIIEGNPVTRHFRPQRGRIGADPKPLALDRPAIAFVGILAELGFVDID